MLKALRWVFSVRIKQFNFGGQTAAPPGESNNNSGRITGHKSQESSDPTQEETEVEKKLTLELRDEWLDESDSGEKSEHDCHFEFDCVPSLLHCIALTDHDPIIVHFKHFLQGLATIYPSQSYHTDMTNKIRLNKAKLGLHYVRGGDRHVTIAVHNVHMGHVAHNGFGGHGSLRLTFEAGLYAQWARDRS